KFEVFEQPVFAQKVQTGCRIKIVLMLSRFLGFRLNVKGSLESDLFLVIDCHVQKFRQVLQFALHVSIPKRGIAFAAAPENVTLGTQFKSDFHGLLDLRGGVSEYLGIWAGGRSVHEPRMHKKTGCGPKQLYSSPLRVLCRMLALFKQSLRFPRSGSIIDCVEVLFAATSNVKTHQNLTCDPVIPALAVKRASKTQADLW